METWRSEWKLLEGRIAGLDATATLVSKIVSSGPFAVDVVVNKSLRTPVMATSAALTKFLEKYRPTLPHIAVETLTDGLARVESVKGDGSSWHGVMSMTAVLLGVRSEVSAALGDPEISGRRRVDRAFVHLSRTLVVNRFARDLWLEAFEGGETQCESLGAVHMLEHGIWAFKAHTKEERTDLVLDDAQSRERAIESAETSVLTEWKIAANASEAKKVFAVGKRQAAIYRASILAAHELASIRYVVVVTKDRVSPPSDEQDGDVTYRFVNVAIAPATPSVDAKRR